MKDSFKHSFLKNNITLTGESFEGAVSGFEEGV